MALDYLDVSESDEQDNTRPIFHQKPVQNPRKTEIEGRPIFDMIDYVEIMVPGQSKTHIIRKVTEEDKQRWPTKWVAYQSNKEAQQPLEGTPIEQWAYLTPARAMEMKAINILTIEDLANLSDTGIQSLGMGGLELRKRAQQHLRPEGDVVKELREEIQKNTELMAEMRAELDTLKSQEKRKPGRPRKDAA